MPKLILSRHGVTPNNEKKIWTGLDDVDMSKTGYEEVDTTATFVAKYMIDVALCSELQRSLHTAEAIKAKQRNPDIPLLSTKLLNEKDYGIYTGRGKEQVRAEVGEEMFALIRRSWDYQIEGGQSLAQVHGQVVVVHYGVVVPLLEANKTISVSSHNNTLRAYVKELEDIPTEEAHLIELGTAETRVYDYVGGTFNLVDQLVVGDVH